MSEVYPAAYAELLQGSVNLSSHSTQEILELVALSRRWWGLEATAISSQDNRNLSCSGGTIGIRLGGSSSITGLEHLLEGTQDGEIGKASPMEGLGPGPGPGSPIGMEGPGSPIGPVLLIWRVPRCRKPVAPWRVE